MGTLQGFLSTKIQARGSDQPHGLTQRRRVFHTHHQLRHNMTTGHGKAPVTQIGDSQTLPIKATTMN